MKFGLLCEYDLFDVYEKILGIECIECFVIVILLLDDLKKMIDVLWVDEVWLMMLGMVVWIDFNEL